MRAMILAILASLALIGCSAAGNVAAQDVPPAGVIWFGTAYDTTTFALTDRSDTFPVGTQIAVVAHLRSVPATVRVTLYTTFEGEQVPVGYTDFTGNGYDIMADLIPAIYSTVPGQLPFQAKDSGGNVLATGTLTIRQ